MKKWSTLKKLIWLFAAKLKVGGVTKTVSGTMVHITDALAKAAPSVLANITPIQDLHGYNAPWPSGGGVSKCPSFANGTHTTTNGLTVTIQDGEITIDGTASGSGYYEEAIESTVMPADAYVSFNNPVGTFNIAYVFINGSTQIAAPSLSPANGTKQPTGLSGATVNKLRIFCNAATYDNFKMSPIVHDGSTPQAWQPYANICPISGRTGAEVYRTGKNLIDQSKTYQYGASELVLGQESIYSTRSLYLKAGTYTVSVALSGGKTASIYFATDSNTGGSRIGNTTAARSFTLASDSHVSIWLYTGNGITASDLVSAQLELGSIATAYEPYQGTTYPVTWQTEAGTVYGGTLDVVTGVLTVNMVSVDLGTLNWTLSIGGANIFTFPLSDRKYSSDIKAICSRYPFKGTVQRASDVPNNGDKTCCFYYQSGQSYRNFYIYDTSYSTADAFKTAMDGVYLCYELATPVTYQLTPQEVQMLLGENYVWSSSGDTVSVTYYAEGNANPLQSLNILLDGNYSNPKTADDVSDKEALEIILGGNK